MTKTKKCNFLLKKLIFSLAAAAFAVCLLPAASGSKNWTLAGEKFIYVQKSARTVSSDSTAKAIPSLVLEQIAENLTRLPRAQELQDRQLYELQKSRISLFLQLSKEVQTRDSILLSDYSENQLKRKVKASDVKIADISKKISDNLLEVKKIKHKYAPQIEKDLKREKEIKEGKIVEEEKGENTFTQIFKGFIPGQKQEVVPLENVVFYKNDISQLFDAGDDKREAGYSSYEFEKACVDASINGLLTGKITVYGSFMSVAVTLYQFPGSKVIGSAVEVGSTDDIKTIASSIAMQITPKVADSMPVLLSINVQPEEAADNLVFTIDDVVRKNFKKDVIIQSGVHTLMFASKGYDTISTSYNFSGNREFSIDVNMKLKNDGQVSVAFKRPYTGTLFANGNYGGEISETNRFGSISVNNHPVLGHFITKDGLPCDFYIDNKLLVNEADLIVKGKAFDRSKYIEKRRKFMYGSYSALIVSLMPTFYCYGNYMAAGKAYNHDHGTTYDEAKRWQTASNVTMGISGACGAVFVYELIRYLCAANTVLPSEAKAISKRDMVKIKSLEEEKSLEQKMLEQLRESAELKESESAVDNTAADADKTEDIKK